MDAGSSSGGAAGLSTGAQTVNPATGSTTAVPANASGSPRRYILWASTAGALAAWTVTLPSDANSQIGDEVLIGSDKAITLLTINGAATIYNYSAGLLSAGTRISLIKVGADKWA